VRPQRQHAAHHDNQTGDSTSHEAREFESAVAIGRDHHGDLDALETQSGDAPGPCAFDGSAPFERHAKLGEKAMAVSRDSTTMPILSMRISAIVSPPYTAAYHLLCSRSRAEMHRVRLLLKPVVRDVITVLHAVFFPFPMARKGVIVATRANKVPPDLLPIHFVR
jgi:hypothetical protein